MNESNDQLRLDNFYKECLDFFIQESDFVMLKKHLEIKEFRAEAIMILASLTLLMIRKKGNPNYDIFETGLIEPLSNHFSGSFQHKIFDEEPEVFIINRIHENLNELDAFFNQHSLYEIIDLADIFEKNSNYYFVSSSILFHLYVEPLSNKPKFCFDKELNRFFFFWLIFAMPKVIKISNRCSLILNELNTVILHKHQEVIVDTHQEVIVDTHQEVIADTHQEVIVDTHQEVIADTHQDVIVAGSSISDPQNESIILLKKEIKNVFYKGLGSWGFIACGIWFLIVIFFRIIYLIVTAVDNNTANVANQTNTGSSSSDWWILPVFLPILSFAWYFFYALVAAGTNRRVVSKGGGELANPDSLDKLASVLWNLFELPILLVRLLYEIVINSMSWKRTVNSKIPFPQIEQVNFDYQNFAMIIRQFIDKISSILFNHFKKLSPGYYRLFRACWLLFPLAVSFLLYAIISLFGHTGFYHNGIMYYEATDIALKWFFILLVAYYPIARILLWIWEGFQSEKKIE